MDPTGQILEDALRYFDAAGVAVDKCVDGVVLILGLSTSPERDLDEGYFEGGRLNFQGWLKHVKPRITSLIEAIAERGVEVGKKGVISLKSLAVMAGLGLQGKNTLIIHPRFGPWWRLAAIRINAPLTSTGPVVYERKKNPHCVSCNACVQACPVDDLLEPYRLKDPARCLANIPAEPIPGKIEWCDRCLAVCPIGRLGATS